MVNVIGGRMLSGAQMKIDLAAVRFEAQRQLVKEKFEAAVASEKVKIRTARPWWHAVIPFTIRIERRK
jgi:hypothetical protein